MSKLLTSHHDVVGAIGWTLTKVVLVLSLLRLLMITLFNAFFGEDANA